MSNFSVDIRARLLDNSIDEEIKRFSNKPIVFKNVSLDTTKLVSEIQNALNRSVGTINFGNINTSGITRQMQQAGTSAGRALSASISGELNNIHLKNGGISNVKRMLQGAGFDKSSIATITQELDRMVLTINKISTSQLKNGNIRMTISGVDEINRAVQIVRDFDKNTGKVANTSKTFVQSFDTGSAAAKKFQQSLQQVQQSLSSNSIELSISKVTAQYEKLGSSGHSKLTEIKNDIQNLKNIHTELASTNNPETLVNGYNRFNEVLAKVKNNLSIVSNETKTSSDATRQFQQTLQQAQQALSNNSMESSITKVVAQYEKLGTTGHSKLTEIGADIQSLKSIQSELSATSSPEALVNGYNRFNETLLRVKNSLSIVSGETRTSSESARRFQLTLQQAQQSLANNSMEASISRMVMQYERLGATGHGKLTEIRNDIQSLKTIHSEMASAKDSPEALVSGYNKFNETLTRVKNNLSIVANETKASVNSLKISSLDNKMEQWLSNNSRAAKLYGESIDKLRVKLKDMANVGNVPLSSFTSVEQQFNRIRLSAEVTGRTGLAVGDQFKRAFSRLSHYFSASTVLYQTINAFRKMYQSVYDINKQMTELKKVTDESAQSYEAFLSRASVTAKEIGSTVSNFISSTADFARLGYTFDESEQLAKVANIYNVVGDDIENIDAASKSIISTMTAFKVMPDDAIKIADKFNEVGKLMPKYMVTCRV